jgi:hypothetical protein
MKRGSKPLLKSGDRKRKELEEKSNTEPQASVQHTPHGAILIIPAGSSGMMITVPLDDQLIEQLYEARKAFHRENKRQIQLLVPRGLKD